MHVAAMGTGHFQNCFPNRAQTLRVCLDAGRCLLIGFRASEEQKRDHSFPQGSQPTEAVGDGGIILEILRRQHVKLGHWGFQIRDRGCRGDPTGSSARIPEPRRIRSAGLHSAHVRFGSCASPGYARDARGMSAMPPIATELVLRNEPSRSVTSGLMHCSKRRASVLAHSITSSARASNVGGTSRPSALAVFKLTISSYLVGFCTGRSAGFSPLRMRST
jgi:hypothetical protein